MEFEVLSDESANVEEVVAVSLSESVVNLNACLVGCIQEVLDEKLALLGEFVIRAQVDQEGSFGTLPVLDQVGGIKGGTCLD